MLIKNSQLFKANYFIRASFSKLLVTKNKAIYAEYLILFKI